MITEIGITAGDIWHHLEENGEVELEALVKGTKQDEKRVLMSLGWLAREGHIIVLKKKDKYIAYLNPNYKV